MADVGTPSDQEQGNLLYLEHYQLKEPPFSITPDPEFFYLSRTHQSALEKILYGIQNGLGFMLLTGEVGTGKTTLCRHLLDRLDGWAETVYIVNPSVSEKELLATILDDLGIPHPARATKKALIDLLNRFLLCPVFTKPVVVIIDDAQSMSPAVLENLRLLSNLETDKRKLLQIILIGQPELVERINTHKFRQLKQRIAISCELGLLDRGEIDEYITRRLFGAGNQGALRFAPQGIRLIRRYSGGIPRIINKICDYALISGYLTNSQVIGAAHIRKAWEEVSALDRNRGSFSGLWRFPSWPRMLLLSALASTLAMIFSFFLLPL